MDYKMYRVDDVDKNSGFYTLTPMKSDCGTWYCWLYRDFEQETRKKWISTADDTYTEIPCEIDDL